MTDLDHEAAERFALRLGGGRQVRGDENSQFNLARCYLATRTREVRLEALVRSLGACPMCDAGRSWELQEDGTSTLGKCFDCAGTGLVEAARKELQDG